MKRLALIAASGAAILATGLAVAQPQPIPLAQAGQSAQHGGSGGEKADRSDRREEMRERRAERMTAQLNERLAKLRTDLKLKPEQVAAFEKIEALIKRNAEQRRERMSQMRDQHENLRHADIMERLDMMATRQAERATRSKEMADAVRPLWTTLSDEQKTVARRAMREMRAEGRDRMMEMHRRMRDNDDDRRDDDRRSRRWRDRDHDHDRGWSRDRDYDSDRF
ncbi:MAG: Spy/CpxP family protein refolding chaperone [Bosea sp.]|uniref:Spy/CpxP family protein refolding chaperone n=1 Tax=Bosea sp. (in: a-proteobacteria) TaxID=1871050 RepID=UPI001ACD7C47|nr:Spy/CpxP family protein refolding chaperone [Bosea sp. (in: a-proteobacteria)]MBN9470356.1 Spy/CpxP family protein refolding chaperone [Bosea sp. (in: a-proteobacteria)]